MAPNLTKKIAKASLAGLIAAGAAQAQQAPGIPYYGMDNAQQVIAQADIRVITSRNGTRSPVEEKTVESRSTDAQDTMMVNGPKGTVNCDIAPYGGGSWTSMNNCLEKAGVTENHIGNVIVLRNGDRVSYESRVPLLSGENDVNKVFHINDKANTAREEFLVSNIRLKEQPLEELADSVPQSRSATRVDVREKENVNRYAVLLDNGNGTPVVAYVNGNDVNITEIVLNNDRMPELGETADIATSRERVSASVIRRAIYNPDIENSTQVGYIRAAQVDSLEESVAGTSEFLFSSNLEKLLEKETEKPKKTTDDPFEYSSSDFGRVTEEKKDDPNTFTRYELAVAGANIAALEKSTEYIFAEKSMHNFGEESNWDEASRYAGKVIPINNLAGNMTGWRGTVPSEGYKNEYNKMVDTCMGESEQIASLVRCTYDGNSELLDKYQAMKPEVKPEAAPTKPAAEKDQPNTTNTSILDYDM